MRNEAVRVVPVSGALSAAETELLVTASTDETLLDATYLPSDLDERGAVAWASSEAGRGWFMYLEGNPVGFYGVGPLRSSCGLDIPSAAVEREVWLTPAARGQGVVRAATELLRERLLERGVEYIVSVIAASNSAAIAGVKNGGFKQLGHGWWEHAEYGRYWCEVWILNLRDSGLDASLAGSGDSSAQG
jgi:RimJ/RimL family protein N-acetyltransferase